MASVVSGAAHWAENPSSRCIDTSVTPSKTRDTRNGREKRLTTHSVVLVLVAMAIAFSPNESKAIQPDATSIEPAMKKFPERVLLKPKDGPLELGN